MRAQRAKSLPCQEKTLQPSRTAMATPIRTHAGTPRPEITVAVAHSTRKGRGMGILEKCSLEATRFEGRRRNRTISCDDPNLLTSCPNSSSAAMPLLLILLISSRPNFNFRPSSSLAGRRLDLQKRRRFCQQGRREGEGVDSRSAAPQIRNPLLFCF